MFAFVKEGDICVCGRGRCLRLSSAPSTKHQYGGMGTSGIPGYVCALCVHSTGIAGRGMVRVRRSAVVRLRYVREGCVCGVEYEMIGDAGRFRT